MTRDELIARTRALVAAGERLDEEPSIGDLRAWLAASDILLAEAWGTMDRYHLVWLSVGHPRDAVRDRPMTPGEEAAYVREVAAQKTAALRMSLDAVERQGMPFLGEDGGVGAAADASAGASGTPGADAGAAGAQGPESAVPDRSMLPRGSATQEAAPDLAERIRQARERTLSSDPAVVRRAPNPERMRH
jgi:hypothetical protein